jgi:DnaK suppressor protein
MTNSSMALRERLLEERATAQARIVELHAEFDDIVAATTDSNIDDEHDPEGSTIAFERAQVAGLLERARAQVDECDRALTRLDAGTYGICTGCGRRIGAERIAARPAAPTCIQCAG